MTLTEQSWFSTIKRPSRYLGNEINCIKKDYLNVEVSIALAFPDLYEVGMSHQGLKILYHILNNHEWLAAERVFSPGIDLEQALRSRGLPISTLESNRPLPLFDIVGFSLQHELSFTNVLTMLDLSHIPFLSVERDDSFPLIIAGGPACFNPEPVSEIFDVIVIGDGEEAAVEICTTIRNAQTDSVGKEEILHKLAKIRGIYIPDFFHVHYRPDGPVSRIDSLVPGYTEVKKTVIPDIDHYPFPAEPVVPFTRLIHDRLTIEISRGCTRGCRFCQAGMIYRPVRERHPERIMRYLDNALKYTGFEEISLLSLSSGDYSCIAPLIRELMDRYSSRKTAISLPSLRIDTLDPAWLEQLKRVRKTGFTLAPEAGNDRMRKVINKSLTNEEILDTAGTIYGAGWNLIKLYFMIGLPGEEDQDLHDIIKLAGEVFHRAGPGGAKAGLNISISTFVPKAHTPFMWQPQISLEESRRRIGVIRTGLRRERRIKVKWNQPELSWLEGVFARGDRRLTGPLIEAWRLGARFDAWGDLFRMDIWKKAFESTGFDPDFYLTRPRPLDETQAWDHIRSGVTKTYLIKEREKALEARYTPDCRERCRECGVCDHTNIDPIIRKDWAPPQRMPNRPDNQGITPIVKYGITFSKKGTCRYLSHLELVRTFIRAINRSGLDIAFSQGHHPMPRISFSSALPVGTESIHETGEIVLRTKTNPDNAREALNLQLPSGLKVHCMEEITTGCKRGELKESHFRITMDNVKIDPLLLENFLDSESFIIVKKGKKGTREINARPLVKSLEISKSNSLNLVIRHRAGPELKPIELLQGIFQTGDTGWERIRILKTKQVME